MLRTSLLILTITIAGTCAWACGPSFPWQLLRDREAALTASPDFTFAIEALHFVDRPTDLADAIEDQPANSASGIEEADSPERLSKGKAEALGLTVEEQATVAQVRAASETGEDAFQASPD